MRDALAAGAAGRGRTHPNPCVGAVVVQAGRVAGRGFHRGPGTPHAEMEALREAGDASRGGDLYVTLEPCCTFGRTPPCTEALLASGLRRVFAAVQDPNPAVDGQGLARLREGGIEVWSGLLQAEAVALDPAYHHFYRKGRPFVHLKWAQTLDGRVRPAAGRYLTGPEARRRVHEERFLADALLVSAGTVLRDDPALTVRLPGRSKTLVRIVLDRRGVLGPGRTLFQRAPEDGPVWIIRPTGLRASSFPVTRGVEVLELDPDGEGGIGLEPLMALLKARRIMALYVEAVGRLAGTLLAGGWVDRLSLHLAPCFQGVGSGAPEPPALMLSDGVSLEDARVVRAGSDWILEKELEGRCLLG